MAGGAGATPDSGEIDVLLERLSASESGITGPLSALTPASGPVGKVALACGAGLVLTGLLLGGSGPPRLPDVGRLSIGPSRTRGVGGRGTSR